MESPTAISICIPAYKNVAFLRRLLDSISRQTFTDYEVIVSDDSPDDSVKELISQYSFPQPLRYYRNHSALGTPENWNAAIRLARGKWIKLMHNDDWFAQPGALQVFMEAAARHPGHRFFFAAFRNIMEGTGQQEVVRCTMWDLLFLRLSPLHLFKRVYVGNPSCTFIRRDIDLYYDKEFKFVVDFEYYLRCIRQDKKYTYIDDVLVNVGFHDEQVTRYTFLVPAVQIPENFKLLGKLGARILYNPVVYDYYWRMFRNLGIRREEQVKEYYQGETPALLRRIIRFQGNISASTLRRGYLSKPLMLWSYLGSLFRKH